MVDHHHQDHRLGAVARVVSAVAMLLIAICFLFLVVWMTRAEQNAKLYLDDNMVCFSQPFAIECHPRTKP